VDLVILRSVETDLSNVTGKDLEMTAALTTLVAVAVLFSRKNNENATTALYPVGAYTPGAVDLDAESTHCVSFDNNMLVSCKTYEVRTVQLPEWLSPDEWASSVTKWKYAWGRGVQQAWPEAWQRGLLGFSGPQQVACAKLLKTKKFRSAFRESLRDQLVAWLETPSEERKYGSPFSWKQWDCLVTSYDARKAKSTDSWLYSNRSELCVEYAA
jgi:hypothetical protein